jgi:molybdopterin/thiamine biosynthesis adenylyltransferase
MSDLNLSRHLPIYNPQKHTLPVHIVGAGATGSRLWLALVELGITNITVYDFDVVEPHNLSNQIYLSNHIGMPKVDALRDYYRCKTGVRAPDTMHFVNEKITADWRNEFDGSVFILTDTMSSRREIFETFCAANPFIHRVFETRMASTHGNVNTVNPNNYTESLAWIDSLVDDDAPGETSACGASISVGTTASVIANLAVWQFILSHTDPVGVDPNIEIFLKPLIITKG